MRAGLDYQLDTVVELPDDGTLYRELMPRALYLAHQMRLADVEGAATDAVVDVVVARRYQETWRPGKTALTTYLNNMVHNRLRDALRAQYRRARWETEAEVWRGDAVVLGEYDDGSSADDAEPGREDHHYDDVETIAALEQLRDRVKGDPFFSEMLDVVAGRALANERVTLKGLADTFGLSRAAARDNLRVLGFMAAGSLRE